MPCEYKSVAQELDSSWVEYRLKKRAEFMNELSGTGWEVESYVFQEAIRDDDFEVIIKAKYVYVLRREK
jgi:hypothetical protein